MIWGVWTERKNHGSILGSKNHAPRSQAFAPAPPNLTIPVLLGILDREIGNLQEIHSAVTKSTLPISQLASGAFQPLPPPLEKCLGQASPEIERWDTSED